MSKALAPLSMVFRAVVHTLMLFVQGCAVLRRSCLCPLNRFAEAMPRPVVRRYK